jgi:prepilin-type N-terminal cleavage/methylation domain-containing protein
MQERRSRPTTSISSRGFTVIEVLVALLIAVVVLSTFTGFYVAQQRGFRRHQVEIASSQSLRNTLEQMSRDLRAAGLDPLASAGAGIGLADARQVDFTLDGNADGVIGATDPAETKKFRQNGTTVESYQAGVAGSWITLGDFIAPAGTPPGPIFRYFRCDGTEVTILPASSSDRAAIARVDMSLTVTGVGGIELSRAETESVRLRNKVCP